MSILAPSIQPTLAQKMTGCAGSRLDDIGLPCASNPDPVFIFVAANTTRPAVAGNLAAFDYPAVFVPAVRTFDNVIAIDAVVQLGDEGFGAFVAIQIGSRWAFKL